MFGYMQIVIAMLIWGSAGVFGRWSHQPSTVIVFYRVFFAALSLVALRLLAIGKAAPDAPVRKQPIPWRLLVVSGLFLALNWLFFFRATETTTIANAVLSYYTAPVIVMLLSPLLLKEYLEKRTLIAAGIALMGLGVMTQGSGALSGKDLLGMGFGLVAALFYALTTIAGKRMAGVASEFIVLIQTMVSLLVLAPFALPRLAWSPAQDWPPLGALGILVVMGLIHTALALTMYFNGVKTVKVQHVGVLGYLDPLAAVGFGWFFLSERPTLATLAGGILILGATWLVLSPGKKPASHGPAEKVA